MVQTMHHTCVADFKSKNGCIIRQCCCVIHACNCAKIKALWYEFNPIIILQLITAPQTTPNAHITLRHSARSNQQHRHRHRCGSCENIAHTHAHSKQSNHSTSPPRTLHPHPPFSLAYDTHTRHTNTQTHTPRTLNTVECRASSIFIFIVNVWNRNTNTKHKHKHKHPPPKKKHTHKNSNQPAQARRSF